MWGKDCHCERRLAIKPRTPGHTAPASRIETWAPSTEDFRGQTDTRSLDTAEAWIALLYPANNARQIRIDKGSRSAALRVAGRLPQQNVRAFASVRDIFLVTSSGMFAIRGLVNSGNASVRGSPRKPQFSATRAFKEFRCSLWVSDLELRPFSSNIVRLSRPVPGRSRGFEFNLASLTAARLVPIYLGVTIGQRFRSTLAMDLIFLDITRVS